MFDSSAILLYLGEKTGRFIGAPADRPELLSWLFFVATGLGPFSGQAVHFQHAAPEKLPYAVNRYRREIERHYRVLDKQLIGRDFIIGDYSIVDMSAWGWLDARLARAAWIGRSACRLPQSQAPVRDGRRPSGRGAGESDRQGSSLQDGGRRANEARDVPVELSGNRDVSHQTRGRLARGPPGSVSLGIAVEHDLVRPLARRLALLGVTHSPDQGRRVGQFLDQKRDLVRRSSTFQLRKSGRARS